MAWEIVTWLAVPVVVVEGTGAIDSLKRSAGLFKTTWGENLVAQAGFGILGLVLMLPALVIAMLVGVAIPLAGRARRRTVGRGRVRGAERPQRHLPHRALHVRRRRARAEHFSQDQLEGGLRTEEEVTARLTHAAGRAPAGCVGATTRPRRARPPRPARTATARRGHQCHGQRVHKGAPSGGQAVEEPGQMATRCPPAPARLRRRIVSTIVARSTRRRAHASGHAASRGRFPGEAVRSPDWHVGDARRSIEETTQAVDAHLTRRDATVEVDRLIGHVIGRDLLRVDVTELCDAREHGIEMVRRDLERHRDRWMIAVLSLFGIDETARRVDGRGGLLTWPRRCRRRAASRWRSTPPVDPRRPA